MPTSPEPGLMNDLPSPERPEVAVTPALVKWFDSKRGFGFVIVPPGKSDIFLHSSVLRRAGIDELQQGEWIDCRIEQKPRGLQVESIICRPEMVAPVNLDPTAARQTNGRVKFYDPVRGYGFIHTDAGDDVFIGAKLLKALGVRPLRVDQPVRVSFVPGEKGLVAETLTFLTADMAKTLSGSANHADPLAG